mmetsp:Transcript_5378/g.15619  ORF Transcript_5378/g.15619 Transcript_5378/m.15619 type:complete len:140 (+) Transcript_5378:826-1245(+)
MHNSKKKKRKEKDACLGSKHGMRVFVVHRLALRRCDVCGSFTNNNVFHQTLCVEWERACGRRAQHEAIERVKDHDVRTLAWFSNNHTSKNTMRYTTSSSGGWCHLARQAVKGSLRASSPPATKSGLSGGTRPWCRRNTK